MNLKLNAPAFPQHGWTSNPEVLERMQQSGFGLTKREYFAIHILAGMCACPEGNADPVYAIKKADRLIEELNKPKA